MPGVKGDGYGAERVDKSKVPHQELHVPGLERLVEVVRMLTSLEVEQLFAPEESYGFPY